MCLEPADDPNIRALTRGTVCYSTRRPDGRPNPDGASTTISSGQRIRFVSNQRFNKPGGGWEQWWTVNPPSGTGFSSSVCYILIASSFDFPEQVAQDRDNATAISLLNRREEWRDLIAQGEAAVNAITLAAVNLLDTIGRVVGGAFAGAGIGAIFTAASIAQSVQDGLNSISTQVLPAAQRLIDGGMLTAANLTGLQSFINEINAYYESDLPRRLSELIARIS